MLKKRYFFGIDRNRTLFDHTSGFASRSAEFRIGKYFNNPNRAI